MARDKRSLSPAGEMAYIQHGAASPKTAPPPMPETWIRPNRRALLFGMIAPLLLAAVGAALAWNLTGGLGHVAWRILGGALLAIGGALIGGLAWSIRQPRLACDGKSLLVHLQAGTPFAVPLEFVEAFLIGQAESLLPGRGRSRTSTIVARLAEKATDWRDRPTKPALGDWHCGQIVIRGTWCEPVTLDLVQRLNQRLADAKQVLKTTARPA